VRRLVIAGTHSGVGKTTITMGLVSAFRQRGLVVQPFKVGPDYIDPAYHRAAAGRPCRNLDSWMMPAERIRSLFDHATRDADLVLIEGVMGVHDGLGYDSAAGSTAEVARLLKAPVILVIDAGRMARSAGALALGYQRFDPDLPLAGYIVNRAGSEGHAAGVSTVIRQATGLPVLGWLPRDECLATPERHLGLLPVVESEAFPQMLRAATERVCRHLDLDALLELADCGDEPEPLARGRISPIPTLAGPRIAVARDAAFQFTYEENLELLQGAGARLEFFSPLADEQLPMDTSGVILSGGFPELHAARLAGNTAMHEDLRRAAKAGMPLYAECGGLMYLCESLVDLEGREWPMVGLLPGRSVMQRRLTLGYRRARAAGDCWLFRSGEEVRGHEFHYSRWERESGEVQPAFYLRPLDGVGEARLEGCCRGGLWASYVHLLWWSKPELAERFLGACRAFADRAPGRLPA
jgi:cobyrinic acid a,c-diamide synthase